MADGQAILSTVRRSARSLVRDLDEALNVAGFWIVGVAAATLPESLALGVAAGLGYIALFSPVGLRAVRRMEAMFGSERAFALAHKRLARPFRDHVFMVRIANGIEDPTLWPVISDPPPFLNDPNASFIMATGHFSRQAAIAAYFPQTISHKLASVMAPLQKKTGSRIRDARLQAQFGAMSKALERVRAGDLHVIEVGGPRVVSQVVNHLKQPGHCIAISSDAPWPAAKGGHARPFAGRKQQNYALGTARLARLAQCPIVSCVPVLDEGRLILRWGAPIDPPAPGDHSADARITDQLLDELELAIGLYPDQYVLSLGYDRRWDSVSERWVGASARDAANDVAAPPAHATAAE